MALLYPLTVGLSLHTSSLSGCIAGVHEREEQDRVAREKSVESERKITRICKVENKRNLRELRKQRYVLFL